MNNDSFDVFGECRFGMMPKQFQQGEWTKKGEGMMGEGDESMLTFMFFRLRLGSECRIWIYV